MAPTHGARDRGGVMAIINGKQLTLQANNQGESFDMHMKKLRKEIKQIEEEMGEEYQQGG